MRRAARLVLSSLLLICVAATAPATAQTPPPPGDAPSRTAPPEKIDPGPAAAEQRSPSPPGGAAQAQSSDGSDPFHIPATVWAARISGGWEADGAKGFSRVVGVFDGDRQRLYVQWLATPEGKVTATKELVDEEAAKLTFGDIRAEPEDSGGVSMFLDTIPDKDGIRDTWVLIVGGPGDTRFGPATN